MYIKDTKTETTNQMASYLSFKENGNESMLVGKTTGGGFETLRGDKTQSFISRTKAYRSKNKHKSWALYLYTKSKYKNSNFPSVKAAGGCGWSVGGCLP